jgi:hypothetical protein
MSPKKINWTHGQKELYSDVMDLLIYKYGKMTDKRQMQVLSKILRAMGVKNETK